MYGVTASSRMIANGDPAMRFPDEARCARFPAGSMFAFGHRAALVTLGAAVRRATSEFSGEPKSLARTRLARPPERTVVVSSA